MTVTYLYHSGFFVELDTICLLFDYWQGTEEPPIPFLSVYRLTGTNRSAASQRAGRFVLREEESVIYSAKFYDVKFDCGLDESELLNKFHIIQTGWEDN